MLKMELKRILKTRSTWWLFGIALALCLMMAYSLVHSSYYSYFEDGKEKFLRGTEAIAAIRERRASIEGEVTEELIEEAYALHNELVAQYGDSGFPMEIVRGRYAEIAPVLYWVGNSYFESYWGISTERAVNFYQERQTALLAMVEHYPQQVGTYVEASMDNTPKPYIFEYGIGSSNTFEFLSTIAILLSLVCSVIAAPIFASDYASGADDILRCTRHGRGRLGLAKLCSALIISTTIFAICIGCFAAISYAAYGRDMSSGELIGLAFNPHSLTAMDCFAVILASALLSFLATTCFTLFLSARFRNPMLVLAIAVAVVAIPTFLFLSGFFSSNAAGNTMKWISLCLPSGGLGLGDNMPIALTNLCFLWIGDFVAWSPYVLLAAAAVQIPIWFALALRCYNRHQAV